jgi:cytochrome P450
VPVADASPSRLLETPRALRSRTVFARAIRGSAAVCLLSLRGGPRQCIGNTLALTEATLILASIAQKYRLRMVPGHPVEPQPLVTLRPRYGLKMMLGPA